MAMYGSILTPIMSNGNSDMLDLYEDKNLADTVELPRLNENNNSEESAGEITPTQPKGLISSSSMFSMTSPSVA